MELPAVLVWGRRLLGSSLAALAIGGTTVNVLFPRLLRRGMDAVTLSILIPIWTIGIAGILFLLVAWIRYPDFNIKLEIEIPERPDGKLFGRFTRMLACFTLTLVWLVCFGFWTEPEELIPLWSKILIFYCATAYCWFLIYLTIMYNSERHHATTTYLNNFTPLIGTLLIPLTWGLLIYLNWMLALKKVDADGA